MVAFLSTCKVGKTKISSSRMTASKRRQLILLIPKVFGMARQMI